MLASATEDAVLALATEGPFSLSLQKDRSRFRHGRTDLTLKLDEAVAALNIDKAVLTFTIDEDMLACTKERLFSLSP